jgi:large subunit ribosomal protein L18
MKNHTSPKLTARLKRKVRIKKRIPLESGVTRLCVFRSNKHIYAQLIDDRVGKVLSSVSTRSKEIAAKIGGHANLSAAKEIGAAIAQIAKQHKIEKVCFDRNGYRYHGKVKAIADAAREQGLKF